LLMWKKSIGINIFWVPWKHFLDVLCAFLDIEISNEEEQALQYLLDSANTGYVNQEKFAQFLSSFGPMKARYSNCIINMKLVLREKWFYGFLSLNDSERILKDKNFGTFLVRFRKNLGSFGLDFVGRDKLYHISIQSCNPGFSVHETANQTNKKFGNVHDVVKAYSVLLNPCSNILPFQKWFLNDTSTEEANELLAKKEEGTFLIRFSSSYVDALAISYVESADKVKHLLVQPDKQGQWRISTDSNTSFPTISELILRHSQLLKIPFGNPAFCLIALGEKWRTELVDVDQVTGSAWKTFMD